MRRRWRWILVPAGLVLLGASKPDSGTQSAYDAGHAHAFLECSSSHAHTLLCCVERLEKENPKSAVLDELRQLVKADILVMASKHKALTGQYRNHIPAAFRKHILGEVAKMKGESRKMLAKFYMKVETDDDHPAVRALVRDYLGLPAKKKGIRSAEGRTP